MHKEAVKEKYIAHGYLFPNGDAAYLDERGEQIVDLQILGWCGLHRYIEVYPDALVYVSGMQKPMDRDGVRYLLRYIRKTPGES